MEIILAIATILGGVTAIWFFWDKLTDKSVKRLEGLQTGGDSFCYWMLYDFDLKANIAKNFVFIRNGEFPLYDVRYRIRNMNAGKDILEKSHGEMNSPADYHLVKWPLSNENYYRVYFHARNGSWHQDLILKKSSKSNCWLAATRVKNRRGKITFEHLDNDFSKQFGPPEWRA